MVTVTMAAYAIMVQQFSSVAFILVVAKHRNGSHNKGIAYAKQRNVWPV